MSPRYSTIPWGYQSVCQWQSDYIGPLSLWKGLCPYWVDTYSWYRFGFPVHNALTKTTIHGFKECLIQHDSTLHSIVSDQGTHFTAIEVQQWAQDHGIHGLTMSPPSRSSRLNRMKEWPFADSPTMSIRGQQLGWLGQCSPEGGIRFESVSNVWYDLFHTEACKSF